MADLKTDIERLSQKGWFSGDSRHILEQTSSYEDPIKYSNLLDTCRKVIGEDNDGVGVITFHPIFHDLCALCAMAFILKTEGYELSSGEMARKLKAEIDFITDAYVDEENPYPFQEVSDERKKQLVIKANVKILAKFLKLENG